MVAAAMPLDELEPWLQARAEQHPVATSLPVHPLLSDPTSARSRHIRSLPFSSLQAFF
jgi:hypothetical protein